VIFGKTPPEEEANLFNTGQVTETNEEELRSVGKLNNGWGGNVSLLEVNDAKNNLG
jgi:hypothetical protein